MLNPPAKVRTYQQDRSLEWLAAHPQEGWRCDIYPSDGSDHHGVGENEATAVFNAAQAYIRWVATDKIRNAT